MYCIVLHWAIKFFIFQRKALWHSLLQRWWQLQFQSVSSDWIVRYSFPPISDRSLAQWLYPQVWIWPVRRTTAYWEPTVTDTITAAPVRSWLATRVGRREHTWPACPVVRRTWMRYSRDGWTWVRPLFLPLRDEIALSLWHVNISYWETYEISIMETQVE